MNHQNPRAAFPVPVPRASQGMTLREYFAAQALISLSGTLNTILAIPGKSTEEAADDLSRICYQVADSMIRIGKEDAR